MTKLNTAIAAIASLGIGIYTPQGLAQPQDLVINKPGVTLETLGSQAVASTTSEILILSGVNTTVGNDAEVTYTSGSAPPTPFDFVSNQTQMTVPITVTSFNGNQLTVTNTSMQTDVPIKVTLNGATCGHDGALYLGLGQTISLESSGTNNIGYNCISSGRSRTLSLNSQDGNFKTLYIYGAASKPPGEPFLLGLNCSTDAAGSGTPCFDVGQANYDDASNDSEYRLSLSLTSDVTVINLTASQTGSVDTLIYSLSHLENSRVKSAKCTCTCP